MAVKIRLKRMGKVRAPHYRIVAVDSRKKRDGRVLEELGTYNPKAEPSIIHVNSERTQYWLGVGAQPSEPVAAILKVTGDWQRFKGEPEPQPMKVAEPKRDKAEIFNEALKEAHSEPRSDAVTGKKAKKAAAEPKADDAGGEDQAKAESRPADDQPKAEESAAEESKAAEPAEESADAEKSEG